MLMQLKPGRHGSDSDVHSLMSAEVGVGDGARHSPSPGPSTWVQGCTGRWPVLGSRPAQVRVMRVDCPTHVPWPRGFNSQNPRTCQLFSNGAVRTRGEI